jgi:hypothetical protein
MTAAPRRSASAKRSRRRLAQRQDDPPTDPVEEALLESFPASDPPSRGTPIRHIGEPERPRPTTPKRGRK